MKAALKKATLFEDLKQQLGIIVAKGVPKADALKLFLLDKDNVRISKLNCSSSQLARPLYSYFNGESIPESSNKLNRYSATPDSKMRPKEEEQVTPTVGQGPQPSHRPHISLIEDMSSIENQSVHVDSKESQHWRRKASSVLSILGGGVMKRWDQ